MDQTQDVTREMHVITRFQCFVLFVLFLRKRRFPISG